MFKIKPILPWPSIKEQSIWKKSLRATDLKLTIAQVRDLER